MTLSRPRERRTLRQAPGWVGTPLKRLGARARLNWTVISGSSKGTGHRAQNAQRQLAEEWGMMNEEGHGRTGVREDASYLYTAGND